MKYKADLGAWERGIIVEFEADYTEAAIWRAGSILFEKIESGDLDEHSYVVQIRDDRGEVVHENKI